MTFVKPIWQTYTKDTKEQMDFIFRKGTECIFLMDSLLKNQEKLGKIKKALKKGFRI